jgi:hypothetical protein
MCLCANTCTIIYFSVSIDTCDASIMVILMVDASTSWQGSSPTLDHQVPEHHYSRWLLNIEFLLSILKTCSNQRCSPLLAFEETTTPKKCPIITCTSRVGGVELCQGKKSLHKGKNAAQQTITTQQKTVILHIIIEWAY